jgi:hypothetical protein
MEWEPMRLHSSSMMGIFDERRIDTPKLGQLDGRIPGERPENQKKETDLWDAVALYELFTNSAKDGYRNNAFVRRL